ncbi:MAG: hypothetical protein ABI954_13520 [Pyrinomonadaceae bacterium]
MKKLFTIFALFLAVGLTAQFAVAQDNKNKTDDKETLIKAARLLEEKPFDKDAKKIREWAMFYIIQTKDVSVTICTNAITSATDKKNKNGSELFGQYTIGMAAFKLENPDKASDEIAAQLAGAESMLKAYEAMVKEKPKAQFADLDALVEKRNKNELAAFVAANGCKEDKK